MNVTAAMPISDGPKPLSASGAPRGVEAGGGAVERVSADFETRVLNGASEAPVKAPGDGAAAAPDGVYRQFEAMVISQLVSAMLSAGGDSVFGEGTEMSAYSSLFADSIGAQIAKRGGIGLAEAAARAQLGAAGVPDPDPAAVSMPAPTGM